jgi:fused-like protein
MIAAYEVLERIGEGSFGIVYRGRRRFTGQFVALKFVRKSGKSAEELAALRTEIGILRRLEHAHIVLLLDYFETAGDVVLVTELLHGELLEVLQSDGALALPAVRSVAAQLTAALAYLHSAGIMHRDLKPQNVLIGSNGTVKLADFGFARELGSSADLMSSIKGTPLYMAPEMFSVSRYSPNSDVWGLGVLLFELAAGRPPFVASSLPELMQVIVSQELCIPEHFGDQLTAFLQLCLVREPGARGSWQQLLQHNYVRGAPAAGGQAA